MIIVGVDPGTRHLGWGVLRATGNRLAHLAHGVIHTAPQAPLPERLAEIDEALAAVLAQHRPEAGSVETLFFHKDPQAAAKLGHARGVVLLCLVRAQVAVFEYSPALVKRTTVGSGRAEKRQVAQMVRTLLGLAEAPPSDAADALALAITHVRRSRVDAAVERQASGMPAALARVLEARGRRGPPRRQGVRRARALAKGSAL